MKLILRDGDTYMLRFDRGEDVIEELKQFCAREEIKAGSLTAIGSAKEVELAYYDVDKKEHSSKLFQEKLEISSVVGNVGMLDGDIIIHAHGVFSNIKMRALAGHINQMVVGATCEVTPYKLNGTVERSHSAEIGLNLMK